MMTLMRRRSFKQMRSLLPPINLISTASVMSLPPLMDPRLMLFWLPTILLAVASLEPAGSFLQALSISDLPYGFMAMITLVKQRLCPSFSVMQVRPPDYCRRAGMTKKDLQSAFCILSPPVDLPWWFLV